MKKTTVVVIDDHKLFRQMCSIMFASNSEFQITGEGGTLEEAINMIKIKRPDYRNFLHPAMLYPVE